MDVDAVKRVKRQFGGTLNDVVLATVVGATRQFLAARGVALQGIDFRAMVPVSVRARDKRGELGNKVAQMVVALPIAEPDPERRYRFVVETMARLKQSHQVQGSELLEELGEWTATTVLTRLVRLAVWNRAYNLIVTNVPGPQIPLYLLGARLRESYPMVPLYANQAVGIALFSYAGGLFWGLNADWDAVPDLHDLADALSAEFELLRRLSTARPPALAAGAGG
jgi:WS/DGAT/MGAT family acyltransferase